MRADRLLAGGGKIFEDVPLDDDDDDEEPPRVTELGGSWVFGRRVSDEASSAEKRLATLIVAALLFALGYWLAAQLGPPLPPPGDGAPHAAAPGGVDPAAVLSKLRYAVRKRIFDARPEQAGDSDSLPELDDSESWSADDDESMWLRTERQGGAARQVASTQDELFTLFFMATAVSSLFFFVFDFVSSSFT